MAKVYFRTYGCSMNQSDSEVMKGIVLTEGHSLATNVADADVLVINSCTVKSNPEQRLFYQLRTRKIPIVVTGCVPQADPKNPHFTDVCVVGTKALSCLPDAIDHALLGEVVHFLDPVDDDRLAFPVVRSTGYRAIIPINEGCLSHCSYCKTKQARGELVSFAPESIEKQFREYVNAGVKEIWLTSQDVAAYGLDKKTSIIALLKRLLQKKGDYRIRLGMGNPQFFIRFADELAELLLHPNMYRFIHAPLQSGSPKILRAMKRGCSVEQFTSLAKTLRKKIPDLTIATDIIVGFPGETEEDFLLTMDVMERLAIRVMNISKFYPRPGTPAAKMKLLPTALVKDRSTRLAALYERVALQSHEKLLGKRYRVLVTEEGKRNTLLGRTEDYVQVVLPKNSGTLGSWVEVEPSMATAFDLRCSLVASPHQP